jgi:hypothetical protein
VTQDVVSLHDAWLQPGRLGLVSLQYIEIFVGGRTCFADVDFSGQYELPF